MSDELSLAELDGEFCEKLPVRNQMRMHRGHSRRLSFRHFNSCSCDCGGGFNSFGFRGNGFNRGFDGGFGFNRGFGFNGGFGGGFGGSAFNSNRTFQSNFNPQFAFGGGGISSFNSNANFTNQNALAFNGF